MPYVKSSGENLKESVFSCRPRDQTQVARLSLLSHLVHLVMLLKLKKKTVKFKLSVAPRSSTCL